MMANWLPTLPPWDAVHPLIVHFPIALLIVAPLFVVLSLFRPLAWRLFGVAALMLMMIGTVGAYVAVASGEAAAEVADRTPAINEALEEHEEAAELTRNLFTGLTVLYAGLLGLPYLLKRRPLAPRLNLALHLVFLALYLGGTLVIARTGHLGGRLVHVYGVKADLGEAPLAPTGGGADADE